MYTALASAVMFAAVTAAGPVHAGRPESACQQAIAKAGRNFVMAELKSRGRCKVVSAAGRTCDPTGKTTSNRAKLAKVLRKCNGVALDALGSGSCAARTGTVSGLTDCLAEGHGAAVESLLYDEFGLTRSETEVTLTGTMTQATATLLPPAQLVRYRAVSTAPIALSDLRLYCVTFADPPESGSSEVGADGAFRLTLAAAGVPFGCFVVDETTGEQVATLVLRGRDGDSTQIQTAAGTLSLGTVSLDLGTGEAVVDASGLGEATVCDAGVTNPVDFTGQWHFACTPGPPGSGYGCPMSPPSQVYLHRIPGTAADGTPRYWLGVWNDVEAFLRCGQVEGLAETPGGMTTRQGERLGVPDGPFAFATPAELFPAIDSVTRVVPPAPPGVPPPPGVCQSTATHCGEVRNGDGAPCGEPVPGTVPPCWGRPDPSTSPPTFRFFTDAECQAICYAMNLYGMGRGSPEIAGALSAASLCAEEAMLDMSVPPDHPSFIRRTGNPIGRFFLARLNYTCDDAASVVHKFATEILGLPPMPDAPPGPPQVCHVTRRAELTLKMVSPSKIVGDFKESASLAPGDPAACTDDSNPQNGIAHMLRNPMRMMLTLTR